MPTVLSDTLFRGGLFTRPVEPVDTEPDDALGGMAVCTAYHEGQDIRCTRRAGHAMPHAAGRVCWMHPHEVPDDLVTEHTARLRRYHEVIVVDPEQVRRALVRSIIAAHERRPLPGGPYPLPLRRW